MNGITGEFRFCGISIPGDLARAADDGTTVFEPDGRYVVRFRTASIKPVPGARRPRLKEAAA